MRQVRTIEIRAAPDAERQYIVEGYATTFDAPYVLWESYDGIEYKEIISRAALEGADMSDVLMLYNHGGRVLARTGNGTLNIMSDDHGLHIRADLSRSTAAREMYEDIAAGLVTQMSWAFDVEASEYDRTTHTDTITRIKRVYDVSAVAYPANDQTEISARARAQSMCDMERECAVDAMRRRAALAEIETMI
nr:MAG TPA: prohead serine protease [Bacteriophage sp.]